jgi:simple sugar transport system substrate-binding protein
MTEKKTEEQKVSRRTFISGTIGGLAVGALAGYAGGISSAPTGVTRETTTTATTTVSGAAPSKRVKAGFIYVGPAADYGYSYGHDRGRKYVAEKLPWLDTVYAESVPETEVAGPIDKMIADGADVVFTTSFGFMDPTVAAGDKHPDKTLWHCSGYKRSKNVGTYFAEFYQLYYLCGLAAGAMNKTGKIGYVAAHPIPEVIRHINAFVLGAREVNPKIEASVVWLFSWFDPGKTKDAVVSLVDSQNADVIAYTEDSPATLQTAQEYQDKGKPVWSFSHYSDMTKYGPTAHLTGQVVEWGLLYEYILSKYYAGSGRSEDLWSRIGDGIGYKWKLPVEKTTAEAVEGTFETIPGQTDFYDNAVHLAPLNPVIPDQYRALIVQRYEEMKEMLFEPFTGPIKDQDGNMKLQAGQRVTHDDLWSMNWFVEGITTKIPT